MWRVVVLHQSDAAGVDADVPDAPVVEMLDRVGPGRRMRTVVAEAFRIGQVVLIGPAGAEEDDLADLKDAVGGFPRLQIGTLCR